MKKGRIGLSVLAVLGLLFSACTENPTKNEDTDTTNPSLIVMDAADTVYIDTITLSGTASDNGSGLEGVTLVLDGNSFPADIHATNDSWERTLKLVSGANAITVRAEDKEGNETTRSVNVFYMTDYLPIADESYWKFVRSTDTISISVDSSWVLDGFPFEFYKVLFDNPDDGVKDTIILAKDTVNGTYTVGSSAYTAISGDTLFLAEYTYSPAQANYGNAVVRFLGDTTMVNAAGISVPYRNCVVVHFGQLGDQVVNISDYILAPNQGFVALKTTQSLRSFVFESAQHP